MEENCLIPVSDFNKLAVLDLLRITPRRTEYNGRYWAFFDQTAAGPLAEYESGALQRPLRDFVASLDRVKTRIFESERAMRAKDGTHVPSCR